MVDFLLVSVRSNKRGSVEVYPKFIIKKSKDLMIRGGDFYAIWLEDQQLWSTDEQDALQLIDRELDTFAHNYSQTTEDSVHVLHLWDAESGMIDTWHKYCQRQMRDSFNMLDEKLIFANTKTAKEDYASKRLPYPLEEGSIDSYDKLISTLYSPEERAKIEWAIGSIVSGDSKQIQKFLVLYGAAGTGKSTVLNIVQKLFDGYYSVFDAKALGSSSNAFALEAFRTNPLVAIQHDGDLSKIEDNTRLNSLVSHEMMTVNEKFRSTYANRFKCFLFMGTNKPVKITDSKSGLIRRLIDVTPSGQKLSQSDYIRTMRNIDYELGAIAYHCLNVYEKNKNLYDSYIPLSMLGATNDFYNFVLENYYDFEKDNVVQLRVAWDKYGAYCTDANVSFKLPQRIFKEELKNYFKRYDDRAVLPDGTRVRSYYSEFNKNIFEENWQQEKPSVAEPMLVLDKTISLLDDIYKDCQAQYSRKKNDSEVPNFSWDGVSTKLSDIDTSQVHYIRIPENHIVIDFDIQDENGNKLRDENLKAASSWPPTYAEFSKSGAGVHLHYIYSGDVTELKRIYSEHIEIKVFTGKSSLRRKLTYCNDIPIATISSGLPLKEAKKVISQDVIQTEERLRNTILKCLRKEIDGLPGTKPNIDFIYKILDEAYNGGVHYDIHDLKGAILNFACHSTHNSQYCQEIVSKMRFKSEDCAEVIPDDFDESDKIIFFDTEVFPNLFLINWKYEGSPNVVRMINPQPEEVKNLIFSDDGKPRKLVGFNCRRYDNHMLYARAQGYSLEMLYKLSNSLINDKTRNCFFGEAYNISYTDVYDFCTKKQSLKKWEIELGIHHQELGLPWDKPVSEDKWSEVAKYCDNDVLATEAVFNARKADFAARQIQVDIAKTMHHMTNVCVNDTTNMLSTKIIFGTDKSPQREFNYRDLSIPVLWSEYENYRERFGEDYIFRVFDSNGLPTYQDYTPGTELPDGYSILPFFPKYYFDFGKSYWIEDLDILRLLKSGQKTIDDLQEGTDYQKIGEGGRVYSEPGMYIGVWDGDVSSMHPHSTIFECLFGPKRTKIFKEIVDARVAIKHKDFDTAGNLLGGVLKPYLNEDQASGLAQALKIVINSIYGLTSAKFMNSFRDVRNKDNIVAKRGALFMTLLKEEVQKRGYIVAHIKTDSIKIPNATQEIKDFVVRFGREYGYSFETEAEFSKFCLVNDAVYVAREKDGKWTATGEQFAVPYVFKKLFSKEPIIFDDLCETKSVTSALYLDFSVDENTEDGYQKLEGDNSPNFIGRVGQFCPIKEGCGGGKLLRESKDADGNVKYSSATGAKGYYWLESEVVRSLGKEEDIDLSYYDKQVDEAIETISKYGDFEWFTSS